MRRIASLMLMLCAVLCLEAQDSTYTFKFGYLSYEKALKAVPGYELAMQQMAELRAQYDAEQQRVEKDFNVKYEEFLEGQRDFPMTILRKRQTELKELLERNIAFKQESREQLLKAEAEAMAPLRNQLAAVLEKIALDNGYAFILNTDHNSMPYANPAMGEDVSTLVLTTLQTNNIIQNVLR